jgi:hypothetical protein
MADRRRASDLRIAAVTVWLIVSAVILAGQVALAFVPESAILRAGAALEWPRHEPGSCVLCGMTTAFLAIARGDLAGARAAHPWSIALFAVFVVNGVAAVVFSVARLRSRGAHTEERSCRSSVSSGASSPSSE